ncbi:MAG: hypothetical protein Q8J78_02100 [Moraxellaceae bacterium]|nr:hypothetical protein [Moraxellaceae bacterium]
MNRRQLLLGSLALLASTRALGRDGGREQPLRLAIHRDVHADYLRFVGARNALSLNEFGGNWSRRDVVEVVLLQQALQRGGNTRPLRFVVADSYSRLLKMLAGDEADISASSAWKIDADDYPGQIEVSQPVIRQGQFEAGLYFPEGHEGLRIVAADPTALTRYTAICSGDWRPDIATLHALGVRILLTESWGSMLGMLRKGRADFVLAPFQPNADFRITRDDLVLLPVHGHKVGLVGTRHFLIGRDVEPASPLPALLNRGLTLLEKNGMISRAYQQSGFFDTRVQNWPRLNT